MAVYFLTNNAAGLLKAFNQAIANTEPARGSHVTTWRHIVQSDNNYYTHTSDNWRDKGFLRADVEPNRLALYIVPAQNVTLTRDVYAYYAGHLIETFIRHFPALFTTAQATPNATGSDSAF